MVVVCACMSLCSCACGACLWLYVCIGDGLTLQFWGEIYHQFHFISMAPLPPIL